MSQCNQDIMEFHDEHIVLPSGKKNELRERANSNRDRIKNGLRRNGKPTPLKFKRQGSYKMGTLIQKEDDDYDIDDGLYYTESQVASMTSLQVRKMVAEAAYDGQVVVETRAKCVRVKYRSTASGYHVDVPVYRENMFGSLQIAAANWEDSDPDKVTAWFRDRTDAKGAEATKRIVRLLKAFVDDRSSKSEKGVSGLVISVLVCEAGCRVNGEADDALHLAMKDIYRRLCSNHIVMHPVIRGEILTEQDNPRIIRLQRWLKTALDDLHVLDTGCHRLDALKAWHKVFRHPFFAGRIRKIEESAGAISTGRIVPVAGGVGISQGVGGTSPPRSWGE